MEDYCIFCLNPVDPNRWREHMANYHRAVLAPIKIENAVAPKDSIELGAGFVAELRPGLKTEKNERDGK
jgi:hypothetical protein